MTGAFLTGVPLQVRVADYSRLQHDLGEDLKKEAAGGWDYEGVNWRDVGSYDTGGGYSSLVPLVLVRREGPALIAALERALAARPPTDRGWFQRTMEGWTWRLHKARIEIYDFGVGVIRTEYEVVAPTELTPAATRRTIEALSWLRAHPGTGVRSPVAGAYQTVAHETVRSFSAAVDRCAPYARREPWMGAFLEALPPGEDSAGGEDDPVQEQPDEWGRLLWLHPVYVLAANGAASSRRLGRLTRPFRATFSKPVEFPDGLFVPGIDSSVVAVRGRDLGRHELPMRLMVLHWAYYALFMEMDRGLLATLDNDKWSRPESLRALEREADRIFAIHMRVQEARARLDSALADLGGGELSLWNTIDDVAKFGDLMAAVEGKVETLRQIAERRVQQAAATRARRTSNILSGLTALTVVTVAIALMTNFIGTPSDAIGHVELRVAIVSAAFVVAVFLYREAQREIARKRQRTPADSL